MNDDPGGMEPAGSGKVDRELERTRKLIASVEELRALLAPLTPTQRERVLELARRLKDHPEAAS